MLTETGRLIASPLKFVQDRVTPFLVLLFQVVVLLSFIAVPVWAFKWSRLPFIGAFVEHTMMINTAAPTRPGAWEVHKLGLPFGNQLAAIDGVMVHNASQMAQILGKHGVGDSVDISVRTTSGEVEVFEVHLQKFPSADLIGYFVIPYITGLIYLVCSLYIFGARNKDPAGRAFALFSASVAIGVAGLFDIYTTHHLTRLWTFAIALAGGALFNLAFLFPQEIPLIGRYPFLRWSGYVPALILALLAFPTLNNLAHPVTYAIAWRAEYVFTALSAVFFLYWTAFRHFRASSPIVREQARWILSGALVSFTPLAAWFMITSLRPGAIFTPYLLLPVGIFPLATGYTILRYRLLNTGFLLNRVLLYVLLSLFAASGYALLVSGLSLILGGALRPTNPFLVGAMVFVLALLLDPVRGRLQQAVDAAFFRGHAVSRERIQTFGRELTQAIDLRAIAGLLRRYTTQALQPEQLHIFVQDQSNEQYAALPDDHDRMTTDLRFPKSNGLVEVLARRRDTLFLAESVTLPVMLQPEKARLALLGCQLFVPLPGRQQLIGWLALGSKRSGEPYTSRDLDYLESLCDQAALAIQRSQVVADLERRVREMNVLTRVAQGINITLAFDDILELIYAQTAQVISVDDFRITLYHHETGTPYYAFYLEGDERMNERENRPIPDREGLEAEVIHSRLWLQTDDYERECHNRGILPAAKGLFAWMGVPLNAGADTIGAIGVGSRDAGLFYSEEQRSLLQAIADQAAGAIVKARLLEETERRARQLATLNEIGRSLTSTLELKPLLDRILKSATNILNCAAGSLFLVDQQTGELVFEVVIGPVAEDLAGKRLPAGKGLVGEAVISSKAIIANNAKRRKEWFDKTDQQTGFDTQDLMVVPMQVKDRVIGVIEVINKLDGSPFTLSDQELLTTFTSQATVAIENARLYTLTDQALSARVEELSVMQRIDRELNAGLELSRAMRITLEWAMGQSGAEAGLVGVLEEGRVRVMTSQGYPEDIIPSPDEQDKSGVDEHPRVLEATLPGLQAALQSGQPECMYARDLLQREGLEQAEPVFGLLSEIQRQLVIPIRREAGVIGVLVLESTQPDPWTEDTIAFLSRLCDHAAIAIANAQLYSEVQSANLAKSRFVSFVAHELKNPMASIKGYTELVAGGMAGPVNEMQSSFLSTVRANVDRMNTIVSDLNDLTKIQVGNLRLDFRATLVKDVIEEVLRSFKKQLEEKNLVLTVNVQDHLPPVWADPMRLNQVLTNLVSNAQKYTRPGGSVAIGAERYSRDENQTADIEVVHIWVSDNGIGIDPADQEKIFQQYFRTEISKEAAAGTGLGLNITKSLVEMQGGQIWFESELDRGTTFHFTVPAAEPA